MSVSQDLKSLRKRSWIELLQYVAISLLIIALFGFLFNAGMSWDFFSKWIMFAFFTSVIGWVLIGQYRSESRRTESRILLLMALTFHCVVWSVILAHAETWKVIWFRLLMPLEVVLVLACADWLERRHRTKG